MVGQAQFIPGFVEGLEGAKAGEERAVNAKFPDDYPEQKLAGKDAEFTVKVKEVAKPIKPEIERRVRQDAGRGVLRQAQGDGARPGSPASTHRSRA